MKFKIDTKEKFTVIEPLEPNISDIMTVELESICMPYLEAQVKNVILDMKSVVSIDVNVAEEILKLQQRFYEGNASFVVCELSDEVSALFEKEELDEMLNCTPSQSEAWDIVQMEEIERELLDGNDFIF
jgi:anti-anti-sigma regulatory factor